MHRCRKCSSEFDGKFCPECGTKFTEENAEKKSPLEWIKSHNTAAIAILCAMVIVIVVAIAVPVALTTSTNGIYYKVGMGGNIDKKNYLELKSGKWTDGEDSGTYKKSGKEIAFYVEFFGETEEFTKGTLENHVLTLTTGGNAGEVYISEKHKHKYGEWEKISEQSCTVDEAEIHTCACGVSERRVLREAAGHILGEWEYDEYRDVSYIVPQKARQSYRSYRRFRKRKNKER